MDPFLLLSLIREESLFDPKAVSPVGAIGLMQLMPETAQRTAHLLSLELEGTKPLHEIELNIALGTHYLNGLLKDFGNVPAALAAYNAGRSRVKGWLSQGKYEQMDEFIEDIPYPETRNYVKRILTSYFHYHAYNGGLDEKGLNIL
jgi:soluble lytic murein transglycosylase